MPASVAASADTFTGRVRNLGLSFFLLFVAYSSAQLLQTALNGGKGYLCLFSVYAAFGTFSLYAPALVAVLGPNMLLPLSASGYVVMVAANVVPVEALLIPSCLFVGACAATLWSAQAVYIGACAGALAQSTGGALTEACSQLNSRFYSVFMMSGALSGLFASAVMGSGAPNAVALLFLLLTCIGCAGVCGLALLPEPADPSSRLVALPGAKHRGAALLLAAKALSAAEEGASAEWWRSGVAEADVESPYPPAPASAPAPAPAPPRPTLLYMLSFLAFNARMRFLLPIMLVSGAGAGLVNGTWMANVAAGSLGLVFVGLVGCVYALMSSLAAALVWSRLAQRPSFGRRWCFAAACSGYTLWYLFFSAWCHFNVDAPAPGPPAPASAAAFAVVFSGAALHGFFDPVLSSFIPATLQTLFPSGRDALCAMSSVRVVYSAGFSGACALSFWLSSAPGGPFVAAQCVLLAAMTAGAGASLLHLQRSVCSIDLRAELGAGEGEGKGAGAGTGAGVGVGEGAAGKAEGAVEKGAREDDGTGTGQGEREREREGTRQGAGGANAPEAARARSQ